jgi:hypothetical protein
MIALLILMSDFDPRNRLDILGMVIAQDVVGRLNV